MVPHPGQAGRCPREGHVSRSGVRSAFWWWARGGSAGEGGWLKWKTLRWQIFISFVNSFRKRWEHLAGTLQLS